MAINECLHIGGKVGIQSRGGVLGKRGDDLGELPPPDAQSPGGVALNHDFGASLHPIEQRS